MMKEKELSKYCKKGPAERERGREERERERDYSMKKKINGVSESEVAMQE